MKNSSQLGEMSAAASTTRATLGATALVVALAVAVASGCGGDKREKNPPATNPVQWGHRVVDFFIRPLNRDLQVLNGLNTPQGILFIEEGNEDAIKTVKRRMNDLKDCSRKLQDDVGAPPQSKRRPAATKPLARVYDLFTRACPNYEDVAKTILEAVPLLSSSSTDDRTRGVALLRTTFPASRRGADLFGRGLRLAAQQPVIRAAGLKGGG